MPQYPFDRRVRTYATSLRAVAQYFVHLFRREKPEGIATRCVFPTVRHGRKHLGLFGRETISTPQRLTRSLFIESGVLPRVAHVLSMAASQHSLALGCSSSLLGKAASARGPDRAFQWRRSGGITCFWSEQWPAEGGESESAAELRSHSPCIVQEGISASQCLVGIATDGEFALILLGHSNIRSYRNSASIVPIGRKNLRSILGSSRNPYFL